MSQLEPAMISLGCTLTSLEGNDERILSGVMLGEELATTLSEYMVEL